MANRNYIPTRAADQQLWFDNFANYIADNYLSLGLVAADNTAVQDQNTSYQQAYTAAQTAATRTPVTIAELVTQTNAMTALARFYAVAINNNPATTDAQRAALQITIRTAPPHARISAPLTWPVLGVRMIGPLVHQLTYRDSSYPSESKVRAKPFGAASMQLFQHVGATPPVDPASAVFVGNFTRLPVTVEHDSSTQGQTAYYYARWVTARGLEGPLVGPVTATIANSAS